MGGAHGDPDVQSGPVLKNPGAADATVPHQIAVAAVMATMATQTATASDPSTRAIVTERDSRRMAAAAATAHVPTVVATRIAHSAATSAYGHSPSLRWCWLRCPAQRTTPTVAATVTADVIVARRT